MRKLILSIFVLALLLVAPLAAQKQEPQHKMVQFQMAVFKKAPKWAATSDAEHGRIFQEHLANVISMHESGKMVIAGPFGDKTDLVGIFIMRATSAGEAKSWVDADPAVEAGLMLPEMHPWWSEDIFKKPSSPLKLDTVYFAFLKKGPNRKEGDDKN